MITTDFVQSVVTGKVAPCEMANELNRLFQISLAAQIAAGMFANPKSDNWEPGEVVQDAVAVANMLMTTGARKGKKVRFVGRDS